MSRLIEFLSNSQPEFRKARLAALYADFGNLRSSNPDGFQANIIAWQDAIASVAKARLLDSNILCVQFGYKLDQRFQLQEYGIPQGLETVERESILNGQIISFDEFFHLGRSIYDKSWNVDPSHLPVKALTWALEQVGLSDRARKDSSGRYIIMRNLEDASNKILAELSKISRSLDTIIPMEGFRQIASKSLTVERLTDTDLGILLKFLSRDKRTIAHNETTVKVKESGDTSVEISHEEDQISYLKTVISNMAHQIELLSQEIEGLTAKAKLELSKKHKTTAVSTLRSRKLLESVLVKRCEILTKLEDVFDKIEEAVSQVEVVKAMKGSSEVLRSLSKQSGGVDSVERIIEDLNEDIAKVDEISEAINDTNLMPVVDEDELNIELSQLEASAKMTYANGNSRSKEKQLERLRSIETPISQDEPEGWHTAESAPLVEG